jgi:RimJ/RimL family protein N-acetyltransferase
MMPRTIDAGMVRLRPYRRSDLTDLVAGCDDPLTQRFLPHLPDPYTVRDGEDWITDGTAAALAAGGAAYAIADPDTDRLLGGAGVGTVDPNRGQAEIGYWVAPWGRGRGVATATAVALAAQGLANGINRMELLTHLENGPSQRVAIAAGFRREGIRRGAGPGRDGFRYDLVAWSRLAGDPASPTPRVLPDLPGGRLSDGVVTLRPLGPDDVEFLYALRTLPDVVATSVPPVAPDRDETASDCERAECGWLAGEHARLVILDAASDEPAGEIGVHYQEPPTGQAMIEYAMHPAWRGRGYPVRAARLVADWAFRSTGIARLIAGTLPENTASQRVLEKAGFRREGYLRGRLPGPAGTRLDDVLFALLPTDPAPPT